MHGNAHVKPKSPHPAGPDKSAPVLVASGLPPPSAQVTGSSGVIQASRLFQGNQEILIDHKGETYRLRITKNDKLILTK